MDLLEVGKKIAKIGLPLLGNVITDSIPGGRAIASAVATLLDLDTDKPDAIGAAIDNATPEQVLKLKQFQLENQTRLQQLAFERARLETEERIAQVRSVNLTMQTEVREIKHRWSGMWRPLWGFVSAVAFGLAVLGLVIAVIVAFWKNHGELVGQLPQIITALAVLFGIPGAILGVAAWHRGQMQRIEAGEKKKGFITGLIEAVRK